MRVFNFIISAVLLAVGVAAGLCLLLVGLFVFALRRLFGRSAAMPRFQRVGPAPRPTTTRPAYTHRDVIDVEATPVKD
jgi:hypothetical protein